MGNQLVEDSLSNVISPKPSQRRLVDANLIRKPLLWLYDSIFRLYHQ
jgi:hypothetical protein